MQIDPQSVLDKTFITPSHQRPRLKSRTPCHRQHQQTPDSRRHSPRCADRPPVRPRQNVHHTITPAPDVKVPDTMPQATSADSGLSEALPKVWHAIIVQHCATPTPLGRQKTHVLTGINVRRNIRQAHLIYNIICVYSYEASGPCAITIDCAA